MSIAFARLVTLPGSAAEPLKAQLKTKTLEQEAELLGRTPDRFVRIRAGQGEFLISSADIVHLNFIFDQEKMNVTKLYDEGKYTAAATILKTALEPTLPYLDLSTNAQAHVKTWVKSMYWDAQYAETARVADVITYLVKDERVKREIALYRVAALIPTARTNDVPSLLAKLQPPNVTNDEQAIWWYATAQWQIRQNQLKPAQETVARLVATRAKDYEWMPPALYLSAQLYGKAKHPDVGKQITEEIRTVYPNTRWVELTKKLDSELDLMPKEEPEQPKDNP